MIDWKCPVIVEACRRLKQYEPLRSFLAIPENSSREGSEDKQIESIVEKFFSKNQFPPISRLYHFLHNRNQTRDKVTLYELRYFRDFCIIKSMPEDLHRKYVDAFKVRTEKLGSQTENKELIALQLAAAALEILAFEDSTLASAKLGPSFGMAYALQMKSSDWTKPFSDRTSDHVFTWGEPPIKGAVHSQQMKEFVDNLIKNGIQIDCEIGDNLQVGIDLIRKWLAGERKMHRYYFAILPESNLDLINELLGNDDLKDLIVVSCPKVTCVNLALTKYDIKKVSEILQKWYQND